MNEGNEPLHWGDQEVPNCTNCQGPIDLTDPDCSRSVRTPVGTMFYHARLEYCIGALRDETKLLRAQLKNTVEKVAELARKADRQP